VRKTLYILTLLSALALAGCGGSSGGDQGATQSLDDVLAAVDGLSGKQRTNKLLELANDEGGELSLYTSSSVDYMSDLGDAFEDRYDLGVSIYKASSDALVQRVVEEDRAGFRGVDVAETNTPGLLNLSDQGILVPYRSPKIAGLVAGAATKDWIGDKFNTFIVAWNTERVPEGHEPASLEELATPAWKGKLVLEADDSDWYKTYWEYLVDNGKTAAEADALFSAIAKNATFVNGHNLMADLTAAGEFDVTLNSYLHTVEGLIKDGAPLAWKPPIEPVISRADGIAVVEKAKHPAAAMLFIDFALYEGQQIFADAELTPARKDLSVPPSIKQIAVDVPDYISQQDEWTKRYEQLVRLGKLAPDEG
jgi:iron(III) transport system substrate-binding protein